MKQRLAALHVLLFLLSVLPRTGACDDEETALVLSAEIRPYIEAKDGFRSEMGGVVSVFSLSANPELVKRQLREQSFQTLVAIGPEAAEVVYRIPGKTFNRMVLMVLDPEKFLGESSLCGVDLRISFPAQLQAMAEKMGKGLRIGIPYDPRENQAWVDNARVQARDQGFSLVPITVRSGDEVLPRLQAAYPALDVLLFIPDPVVIAETLVSHCIKDATKHGVPTVGYNSFFLRAGAVLSFNLDYRAIGVTAGKVINEKLSGNCRLWPPPFEVGWNEKAWRLIQSFREARQ